MRDEGSGFRNQESGSRKEGLRGMSAQSAPVGPGTQDHIGPRTHGPGTDQAPGTWHQGLVVRSPNRLAGDDDLHAAVLLTTSGRAVGGNGLRFAEADG